MLLALLLLSIAPPTIEVGQSLTPPAQVAGPWEALVKPGEVAGFSLHVITNANETVRSLNLDTYVRKGGKTARTWWSSGYPGTFVLRSGQFRFHQARGANDGFDVTLDLAYDPNDAAWKGSFSDPFFSGHVTLRRPNMSDSMAPVGTWRTHSDIGIWAAERVVDYGCLNIGVGQDDSLVLWDESHGLFLGKDKAQQPLFGDAYGDMYDDTHATNYGGEWSFIAGTGLWGDRITGAMSSHGSSFGGYYSDHYGNGAVDPSHPRRVFAWTRLLNLACRP